MKTLALAAVCLTCAALAARPALPVRACVRGEPAACATVADRLRARVAWPRDDGAGARLAERAVSILRTPPGTLSTAVGSCREGDDGVCLRLSEALDHLFSGDDQALQRSAEATLARTFAGALID